MKKLLDEETKQKVTDQAIITNYLAYRCYKNRQRKGRLLLRIKIMN